MSRPGSTHAKRQRELARTDKNQDKKARRAARKEEADTRPDAPDGVDPDLAGMVPGPQPPLEDFDY